MNKPTITDGEILSRIIIHAAKQKRKSRSTAKCLYRESLTPNCPIRCFVGIFIDDDDYNIDLESRLVVHINNNFKYNFTDTQLHLLNKCQQIHDTINVSGWADMLVRTIEINELSISKEAKNALNILADLNSSTVKNVKVKIAKIPTYE